MYFELKNDDIESSKRRSTLLIFILTILTKPYVIRHIIKDVKYIYFLELNLFIEHVLTSTNSG